jgi:hypothetical protein
MERDMSVIVIAETPGLDAERYERIVQEQGRRIDELPAGCTAHFAGPAGKAWRVIAVRDSAEQAAEFGRAVLAPVMQRAGFTPSRPQVFPLHCAQTRSEA